MNDIPVGPVDVTARPPDPAGAFALGPYRIGVAGEGDAAEEDAAGTAVPEVAPDTGDGTYWVRLRTAAGEPILTETSDPRVVLAVRPEGLPAAQIAGAPLLAWAAAVSADVCVIGSIGDRGDGGDGACSLTVVPATTLATRDAGHAVCVRGSMVYDEAERSWLSIRALRVLRPDGAEPDLESVPEADRIAVLTDAGVPAIELHARRHPAARLDPGLRVLVRAAEREALVPLARSCAELRGGHVAEQADQWDALREMQTRCLHLYGRLEPERALAWTLEELGELAQAIRRGESTVRVEEELGQVMAWCCCLANIMRVDLAHAFGKAFTEERLRQLAKYGAVRPYRRQDRPA